MYTITLVCKYLYTYIYTIIHDELYCIPKGKMFCSDDSWNPSVTFRGICNRPFLSAEL